MLHYGETEQLKMVKSVWADLPHENAEAGTAPEICSITYNDQGQNSFIIEINDEWIFKFPRHRDIARELKGECTLLTSIAPYITLRIPAPVMVCLNDECAAPFIVYKKISGVSMSRSILEALPEVQQLNVARQVAQFLQEMKTSELSAGQLPEIRVNGHDYWQNFLERLRILVFPHIRPDAAAEIEMQFQAFLDDENNFNYIPSLIHGDLGAVNLIWKPADSSRGQLEGVIDFGQAVLGDPAVDIASLICPRSLGDGFADLLRQVCPQDALPELDAQIRRARFYISTFALQDALFGAEHDDAEAFQDGISQYI